MKEILSYEICSYYNFLFLLSTDENMFILIFLFNFRFYLNSRRLSEADRELQQLQDILNERDNEIAANNRQVTELSNQLTDVERELKRSEEEFERQRANSDAIRELCSKLDIEKEKLKEELLECSNMRRKVREAKLREFLLTFNDLTA